MELEVDTENLLNSNLLFESSMNDDNGLVPSKKNLEELLDRLFERDKHFPNKFVLLGSYGLIMDIDILKNQDVSLYRKTKDLDIALFPKDEEKYMIESDSYMMPYGAHMIVPIGENQEFYAEIFTYTSLSEMVGDSKTKNGNYNDLIDLMFDKDRIDDNFLKFNYKDHEIYIPKPFILIGMKVRAYEKRFEEDKDRDRNDLAFLRGYIPGIFNNSLKKLSDLGEEYKIFKLLREKYEEMFNPKSQAL